MTGELALKSATELRRLFEAGEASPSEVLSDVIARANMVEPTINAFVEEMYDDAYTVARAADQLFATTPADAGPLEGIPIAVKERHGIRGKSVAEGTLAKEPTIAAFDSPIVERLRKAGAILHARTTTPEFSCAAFTHSRLWGLTRNPWNPAYSPGGSSGGSAAAVAAGTAVLATGSDIGGSTRVPAGFCGLVGYKAPYGRVPGHSPVFLDTYRSDGPLARTVADTALMYGAIAGQHPADPVTLRETVRLPDHAVDARGLRVAYARTLGDFPVEAEVASRISDAAQDLSRAGAEVSEISLAWSWEEMLETIFIHWGGFFGRTIADVVKRAPDEVTEYARAFGERAVATINRKGLAAGLNVEARIQSELAEALKDFDVLLCPTAGAIGFEAGVEYADGITVDGKHLDHYLVGAMTIPFNICNRSPVMSVPVGISEIGLPIGAQIVGKPYDDAAVFKAAYALEAIRPWQTTAPDIEAAAL